MYDVQQLLKQFGMFIYVGNRLWDIEVMMTEIRNLYKANLIDSSVFSTAMIVLKKEYRLEKIYQGVQLDGE